MAFLDSCPDEILQLIFFDLPDPSSLSRASCRLYAFSQDPYVRAHYFIARYGKLQGIYFALARGKLLSRSVLDILIASGAHLSRYLVQVAIHHYFHAHSHFIKPSTPWVRNVSLDTFSYFLKLAADKYGDIPRGKGEDDGTLFSTFIKEAKFPLESQRVSWEVIRDIFENYHFMPFCNRDPLMAQFPLALAIEPRLLPYAVANGFYMDAKYRDFVFRKMFERTLAPAHPHAEEIVANVRELCRLADPDMFVTRTVAAEVCLEAKTNEAGYIALKQLDRAGDLAFSLTCLFVDARAITTASSAQILTQLFTDFLAPPPVPAAFASTRGHVSVDPTVRRAMLLTVFASDPPLLVNAMPARLAPLRLGPVSLKDAEDILLSAFVERHVPVFEYLRREGVASGEGADGTRKVTGAELRALAEDVAIRCLTREGKGKTLKRLCDAYPNVKSRIAQMVLSEHEVKLDGLGEVADGIRRPWRARLARSMWGIVCCGPGGSESESEWQPEREERDGGAETIEMGDQWSVSEESEMSSGTSDAEGQEKSRAHDLGAIGLEPLSTMIRRDEMQNGRGRRRYFPMYSSSVNNSSRLPTDAHSVSKWIKTEFGAFSSVTATFLTHAVINGNNSVLSSYLIHVPSNTAVPVTLEHFQVMAKLGTGSIDVYLYDRIKEGAPFYRTKEDYLKGTDVWLLKSKESQPGTLKNVKAEPGDSVMGLGSSVRGRKRPRRSAVTAVDSYTVPDSDDEAIAAAEDLDDEFAEYRIGQASRRKAAKVERVETDLEAWIKALGELQKEEQRKYREKKRSEQEKAAGTAEKIRVAKSDFLRSLTMNLRKLRELEREQRLFRGPGGAEVFESDAEDGEYVQAPRSKRRKTTTTN
ncbi:hypothetical protein GGX14DRAFT_447478 [Mycena pura]|uniref:Uncharacterized protein n=1 Tax=Mycena pura TaxID=153505 RepID=A0AAD6VG60_9AGAR|nr:hypothetical protein GGX14DRAFT_447478 [Mycena pura]